MYDRPQPSADRHQYPGGRSDVPPAGQYRPAYPSTAPRPTFTLPPAPPPAATAAPTPEPLEEPRRADRDATDYGLSVATAAVGITLAVGLWLGGDGIAAVLVAALMGTAAVLLTRFAQKEDWRRLDLYDRQQAILTRARTALNAEAQRTARARLDYDLEVARLEYRPAEIAAELMSQARRLMAEISRRAEIDPPTQYVLDAYVTAYTAIQDAYAPFMAGHQIRLTPEQEIRRINAMLHHLDELARDSVRQKTGRRPTDPGQGKGQGGQP
jgi:hypothetical protein